MSVFDTKNIAQNLMEPHLQQATVVQYTGDSLESGQFHGHGRAEFRSGQVYEGEWQHGHMDGLGKLIFPDGVCYQGSLLSNKITGRGVYQWGTTVYEGEVLNGLRHGYGTLTFTDSPVGYEGEWRHGKRHGRGVIFYDTNRSSYYEGDWQDDMKHGQGTSVYPNGNSYSGSWAYDKREGPGTMAWTSRGQVYSGMWAKNLPNGLGQHVWQHCMPALQVANHAMHLMFNRYFGLFKDGKRHGEGALWYSSGARYEGQWDNDRKQGNGVYVFEDGTVFAGEFAADRPILQSGSMFGAASTCAPAATADTMAAAAFITASPAGAAGGAHGPSPVTDLASTADDKIVSRAASTAQHTAPIKQEASVTGTGSTVADSLAAGPAAGVVANSSPAVVDGPPGFGPRISSTQLYIADVLQECDAPAATYKAVINLLTGCNTELRALYDRYCNRLSPLLDPDAQRNSWALQAGQVWELLKDSQLLCRHMQLQHVCEMLQQTLEPPQPVLERRQQVLHTPDAVAVLMSPQKQFDPTVELLFKDFCELLVRISAVRYPQLPCLERQLQQVLLQHLLPLLGSTGRQGGGRQSMQPRASLMQVSSGISSGSTVVAVPAVAGVSGPEQLMQQDDLVIYLQSQAHALQQLFTVFAGLDCDHTSASLATVAPTAEQQRALQQQQDAHEQRQRVAETAWMDQAVTARQVVGVLQQASLLQLWQTDAHAVAAVLLEGALGVSDPEGLRARLDDTNLEPPDSLDASEQAAAEAATAAAIRQELLFWMDAPLLHAEVLWGLVRCAATLQLEELQAQQGQQQQPEGELREQQQPAKAYTVWGHAPANLAAGVRPLDLAAKVQALLEGRGGLFEAVLGVQVAAAENPQQQTTEDEADPGNADGVEQQQDCEDAGAAEDDAQGLDGASTVGHAAEVSESRPDTAGTHSSPMGQGAASPQPAGSTSWSPSCSSQPTGHTTL